MTTDDAPTTAPEPDPRTVEVTGTGAVTLPNLFAVPDPAPPVEPTQPEN